MELNQFVAHFAAQFDDTNPADISATTVFRDIDEWSSLTALSIIAMVDEKYEVQLKGDDIRNAHTVQDLFDAVNSKK